MDTRQAKQGYQEAAMEAEIEAFMEAHDSGFAFGSRSGSTIRRKGRRSDAAEGGYEEVYQVKV